MGGRGGKETIALRISNVCRLFDGFLIFLFRKSCLTLINFQFQKEKVKIVLGSVWEHVLFLLAQVCPCIPGRHGNMASTFLLTSMSFSVNSLYLSICLEDSGQIICLLYSDAFLFILPVSSVALLISPDKPKISN